MECFKLCFGLACIALGLINDVWECLYSWTDSVKDIHLKAFPPIIHSMGLVYQYIMKGWMLMVVSLWLESWLLTLQVVFTLESDPYIWQESWANPASMRHCRMSYHHDMPMADFIMLAHSVFPSLVWIHRDFQCSTCIPSALTILCQETDFFFLLQALGLSPWGLSVALRAGLAYMPDRWKMLGSYGLRNNPEPTNPPASSPLGCDTPDVYSTWSPRICQ